ncbi:hypothetical protein F5887DRAFT_1078853 [Amanita rubescens]|nr:hypothetical protein F5887DRAFT_1078853 [Amanita rubescens]
MSEQQQQQQQDHYRMWLNNHAGKQKLGKVEYIDEEIKEGSQRTWKSTVQINGTDMGSGEGSKKAEAKEMAAKQALVNLGVNG